MLKGGSTVYTYDKDLTLISRNRLSGNIIYLGPYKEDKFYAITEFRSAWEMGRASKSYMKIYDISCN